MKYSIDPYACQVVYATPGMHRHPGDRWGGRTSQVGVRMTVDPWEALREIAGHEYGPDCDGFCTHSLIEIARKALEAAPERDAGDERGPLVLMDSAVSTAARVPTDVRIAGRRQDFDLPVWVDNTGDIRIGLPKQNPEHSGDLDQVIFDAGELFAALGLAVSKAEGRRAGK